MQTMNRRVMVRTLLGAAGAAVLLPRVGWSQATTSAPAVAASEPARPPSPFETAKVGVRRISDSIDMLLGPGGNIAVLHGSDGQLVVDCGIPQRSRDVLTALKGVSADPLKLLVNTHWHFDHAGGNEALAKAGATIVAHENTRQHLSEKVTMEFFKMTLEPAPLAARPVVTFADTATLHFNGETVALTHVPPAHTDGDIIVYFQNADVLHTGDLLFNGFYPFIDYSTGGSVDGMIAASEIIAKMAGAKTTIIPGHGAVGTVEEVKAFGDMLKAVRDAIRPLVEAGKSVKEVVAAKPLAALDDKWGKGMFDSATFTQLVYAIETLRLKK